MNRHHPYGGYDAGPADRNNRPGGPGSEGGYSNEGTSAAYYPSSAPPQQHHQIQQSSQHYPQPPLNGQHDYQGGPHRDYENAGYPDYRAGGPPANMPPPGRLAGQPALTLGSGPLNNPSQYGGPIRYDGASSGQSPAPMMNNHNNPYGPSSAPQRYGLDGGVNPPRNAPPMRPPQGYDSHLPPKPDPSYGSAPPMRNSLVSPPAHLPRPPGREWSEDQPAKRARRDGGGRAEEEKTSDEVIRERLRRERPCRTLFVRNVEFNADISDLRRRFEAFGEIKSWFDLTSKRGLLFISYFDMRCAEHAKAAMQEFEVNGRRLDVHYSLPRESDMTKRCDREKDQGTLFILLKKAQGELNDEEVRATFAQFGEIKSLRRYKDQGNCRFLEYYDCRACKAAHDGMIGVTWNGGSWDMKFAWDAATPDRIADKPKGQWDQQQRENQGGYGSEYGGSQQHQSPVPGGPPRWGNEQSPYAPPPPAPAPASAYPSYGPPGNEYRPPPPAPPPSGPAAPGGSYGTKRPYDYDERVAPEPPMRRWGQPQGNPTTSYGPPRPEQGGLAGYDSAPNRSPYGGPAAGDADYGRYGNDRNDYGRPPSGPTNQWSGAPTGYGAPPPPTSQHGGRPPPGPPMQQRPPPPPPPVAAATDASASSNDDRLEQAQKVQQLLASLKPGTLAGAPPRPPTASSPAPAAATSAAAASAPAPSLPSNIAALLAMAQNNAAKK